MNESQQNCQAISAAGRRGWRQGTDRLCASSARETVIFHGRLVPVCRMHSDAYERKPLEQAEAMAAELWEWTP